jgi:hypothetical protein
MGGGIPMLPLYLPARRGQGKVLFYVCVKVKVKLALEEAIKTQTVSRGIALVLL